jgi:hypothetical protein
MIPILAVNSRKIVVVLQAREVSVALLKIKRYVLSIKKLA